MRFQPKTEKEVSESGLLPKDKYPFEVVDAAEGQSKAGNDMIEMKVIVFDGERKKTIFDYLVSTDSTAYKIRHFADSIGKLAEYEAGNLDADELTGASGFCMVDIQPEKNGYPAKNVIRDYCKRGTVDGAPKVAVKPAAAKSATKVHDDMDDSIPF